MDYEDFLSYIYIPLKSIGVLSDIIESKCNEDWKMFTNCDRGDAEELLALNFLTNITAKYLLEQRQKEVNNL